MITTTYSLVEICKIRSGKRLPKGCDFSEEPTAYKYIRARDIKNGTIDGSDLVHISEEVQNKIKKYIVNTNDIVITIVGASVGDVAYVASEFDGMNLTENAVRLTEFAPHVNSKYLMYILNSLEYWELMQQIAGGAAQPKLGIYKIEAIKVHLPAKEVQDRIVDILCAYDDLIENNQKQIKLLEEAAQRLYKEWFVDLRFPGHETTPIIDGIPEGWVKGKIFDFVSTFSGGTPSRTHSEYYSDGTNLWVKTQELNDCFIFDTEEKITNDAVSNSSAKRIPQGSILMAMYGATIGKLGIAAKELTCNQACCVFDLSKRRFATSYLFLWLKENRDFFVSQGKGAAQPNLSQAMIKRFDITIPADNVLLDFAKVIDTMLERIAKLQLQNIGLTEARDRLLPKLMNGEIEV